MRNNNQKSHGNFKLVILAIAQASCVLFAIEYLVFNKYADANWQEKSGVVLLFLLAFIEMVREIRGRVKRRNLDN